MNRSRFKPGIMSLLLMGILFPVAGGLATHLYLPHWQWVHVPVHSLVETVGAFAALSLAALLLLLQKHEPDSGHRVWMASALIGMGILDLFHSGVEPGNTFVWLRGTATLAGGFLFALVWLPEGIAARSGDSAKRPRGVSRLSARTTEVVTTKPSLRSRDLLPGGAALAAVVFGAFSIAFPGALPAMVTQGVFTPAARAINVLGGLFFLAAAARFVVRYRAGRSGADFLFANLCLLFGFAGLLFWLSQIWGADWWFWHALRLIAYLIALGYVFAAFRRIEIELRAMNDALEQRSGELARANEALQAEISERQRAEETVTRQAREILEISTPVVQVWQGVLAAPLIGVLDSQRTQQLTEALLQRIVETRARVVILDITGVPLVDTAVANHLIKTVRAASLLGARCLLVGIRPEIAQTVVYLGVDLSGIETCADLQSGLERAVGFVKQPVLSLPKDET